VQATTAGDVISALQVRKGELLSMDELERGDRTRLSFQAPTRGLVGFKTLFAGITQGEGILNRSFTVRCLPCSLIHSSGWLDTLACYLPLSWWLSHTPSPSSSHIECVCLCRAMAHIGATSRSCGKGPW
jgi:hypothetical protein